MSKSKFKQFGFRFRVAIFLLLYLVGFVPPWQRYLPAGKATLWLAASTLLARTGWIGLAAATLTVTIAALACLVLGSILRVWGTAFLGSSIMQGTAMQGEQFIAAGPYRYVRNPLYLGAGLLALGASILMPLGGALFFLPTFALFVLFLIVSEEQFLAEKQPTLYQHYCRRVGRLLPKFSTVGPSTSVPAHWLQALLAETYPIAFTLSFATFAWRYNAHLLIKCLLISYGLSLVMRAIAKPQSVTA